MPFYFPFIQLNLRCTCFFAFGADPADTCLQRPIYSCRTYPSWQGMQEHSSFSLAVRDNLPRIALSHFPDFGRFRRHPYLNYSNNDLPQDSRGNSTGFYVAGKCTEGRFHCHREAAALWWRIEIARNLFFGFQVTV